MRPSQILDPADRQRIEAALFEAHKGTRSEIAVVVVRVPLWASNRAASMRCGQG